jgi:hypothetical protein
MPRRALIGTASLRVFERTSSGQEARMPGLEEYFFDCPYCTSRISTIVDSTGGRHQSFTEDCEVCCRPIAIHLALDRDGVTGFVAEQE